MGVLITPMALAHPLHPIKSRSRNKRRNLWVVWCVSSWRPWFWPVHSIYYIHTTHYIKNNAWVTVNNEFLGHEWGDLPIIFTSDEVTGENYWKIASRVTQKSLFTVTKVLLYFLHAILRPWMHNSAKNNHRLPISPLSPRTVFFLI